METNSRSNGRRGESQIRGGLRDIRVMGELARRRARAAAKAASNNPQQGIGQGIQKTFGSFRELSEFLKKRMGDEDERGNGEAGGDGTDFPFSGGN